MKEEQFPKFFPHRDEAHYQTPWYCQLTKDSKPVYCDSLSWIIHQISDHHLGHEFDQISWFGDEFVIYGYGTNKDEPFNRREFLGESQNAFDAIMIIAENEVNRIEQIEKEK